MDNQEAYTYLSYFLFFIFSSTLIYKGNKRHKHLKKRARANIKSVQASPDKTCVAYLTDTDTNFTNELYLISNETGTEIKLSNSRLIKSKILQFKWAPDSSSLSYIAVDDIKSNEALYTVKIDGTNNIKVSEATVSISNRDIVYFDWSPDSSKIAYIADADIRGVYELYLSQHNGKNLKKITSEYADGGYITDFQWAPDGNVIAYIASRNSNNVHELYTVHADGYQNIKVSGDLQRGSVVNPLYSWAADSNWIKYIVDQKISNANETFKVKYDGSGRIKLSSTHKRKTSLKTYSYG